MKNGNRLLAQVLREVAWIFENIWQTLKESGPCCGIRFSQKMVSQAESNPILCACYKMRM
jgi:hypothetical protein